MGEGRIPLTAQQPRCAIPLLLVWSLAERKAAPPPAPSTAIFAPFYRWLACDLAVEATEALMDREPWGAVHAAMLSESFHFIAIQSRSSVSTARWWTVLLLVCRVISAVRSDPGPSWCYLPLHVDREPCLRLSACLG